MTLPREIALTPEQIEDFMLTEWNLRIASHGPGPDINLTPMWFGWAGGKVYIAGRGQKVVNIRRNPHCTVLLDRNEKFPELQGIMMRGTAEILEDADAEALDPDLAEVRVQMGKKYYGEDGTEHAATARGRNRRWIVFTPGKTVTWDNFKLKQ